MKDKGYSSAESTIEAIKEGIKDYNACPAGYVSMETAIKYALAKYIWNEITKVDISEPSKVLDAIKKITE